VGAVDKTGDVMSGTLSAKGVLSVYGSAETERQMIWQTGGSTRWAMIADSAAESGSPANAGSNLVLRAVSDLGTTIGDVFEVTRSSRKADFKVNPSINGSEVIKASDFVTTASSTGSMTLPSGIIMKWGSGVTSSGSVTITFATAFPTAAYNIQLTITGGDSAQSLNALKIGTFTRTAFNAYSPSGTSYGFNWFAIGI